MGQTNTNNPQRNCYSSCDERPVRSLHPFGLGYVSRPIYVITTQHSLSLTSLTCIPNSITYALLAFSSYPRRLFQTVGVLWTRQKYRLTKFHYYHTSSEDTICPPAVLWWRILTLKKNNRLPTFWSEPINSFGSFFITRFINCSLTFIFLPSLAPWECAIHFLPMSSHDFIGWFSSGVHCQEAPRKVVANYALSLDYC